MHQNIVCNINNSPKLQKNSRQFYTFIELSELKTQGYYFED